MDLISLIKTANKNNEIKSSTNISDSTVIVGLVIFMTWITVIIINQYQMGPHITILEKGNDGK